MIKLYRVRSIADKFLHQEDYYDKVEIRWSVLFRRHLVTVYKQAIMEYPGVLDTRSKHFKRDPWSEIIIDRLFTEEEALNLTDYLSDTPYMRSQIREISLPIIFYWYVPTPEEFYPDEDDFYGITQGTIKLNEQKDYNLIFATWGFYNIDYISEPQDFEY